MPASLANERVTIAGEVEDVLDPRTFTLETESSIWKRPLTVIAELPIDLAGAPPEVDDVVIVTGTVRDDALVAETIRRVGELARWSADPAKTSVAVLAILNAADAVSLVGQRVKYNTVRIQHVHERTLWVGPNARRAILVVPSHPRMLEDLAVGDLIELEGTIRQMPSLPRARTSLGIAPTITDDEIDREHVYIDASEVERRPAS
jgi:hypothetical protein